MVEGSRGLSRKEACWRESEGRGRVRFQAIRWVVGGGLWRTRALVIEAAAWTVGRGASSGCMGTDEGIVFDIGIW